MAADLSGRAERRRQQRRRRRRVAVGGGVAAIALLVVIGVALATSGGGDDEAVSSRSHGSSTSTSSSTTTSMVPVPTTVIPKSTNAVVALAQQYDGAYDGTFTNTTSKTTGPVHLELRIDPAAGTLAVSADFDGNVFGGSSPAMKRTIETSVPLGNPTAQVITDTTSFGKVSGHVGADFTVELSALNIPEPVVKSFVLTGRLRADHTGFDATYHVVFENGDTADGTVTVICAPAGQRPSEVKTLCPAA